MRDAPDVELAVIERNWLERTRIAVRTYEGSTFVDLRRECRGADKEWHPTKKGVTFRAEEVPEVIAALQEAQKVMGEDGDNGEWEGPE